MAAKGQRKKRHVRLIITNLKENHAEKGLDWIVMTANAVAVAVVLLASASANPFEFAETPAAPAAFKVASLD